MMLTRRNTLLIPGVLALGGCTPPSLDVRVSGTPSAIKFSARRGEGPFGIFSRPAPIGAATVRRWPWAGEYVESIVWEINADGCQLDLTSVQYGVVPVGFDQTTPAQPLIPNDVYIVEIQGCAYLNSPGFEFFKMSNDRVHRVESDERDRIQRAD